MARKKTFDCGHTGYGKFCHRCADEERRRREKQSRKEQKKQQRQAWQEHLAAAPVSLDHVPPKTARKVLETIEKLRRGQATYMQLNGKRLITMGQRNIISIPIGWSWRLVCEDTDDGLVFLEVLSHEAYNNKISSGGWDK